MATKVEGTASSRVSGRGFMADQGFFVRYAIVLALFILAGFAQFAMRGFSNVFTAPPIVHLHGGLMVGWLGIFVAQNMLVHRGELGIHRKLGWVSVALIPVIVVVGIAVAVEAIRLDRQPPFFTKPFLLALTTLGAVTFGGLVIWAVALRRQVQWHRRAMLGAMIVLSEPALGRLLPIPLMNGYGQWGTLVFQLIFVGVLGMHDRKVLGAIHPATKTIALVLIASHALFEGLAVWPPFIAFADAIAAG